MTHATISLPPSRHPVAVALRRLGELMQRNRRSILAIQWIIVGFYVLLVAVPAFIDLPPSDARLFDHLTLIAQFVFWGIWWPFVILSMMLIGRVWCGVFCPEGALSEFSSRHGLGRPIPKWLRWPGWPMVAFLITTVYGQLVSVYDYPKPALLILGGSTLAAMAVGFVYGRGKRVWCRHLCPVTGVFAVLSRLAPVHFAVDDAAWHRSAGERHATVDCAPLVDLRHMKREADCHMCGNCAGHRGAIALAPRAPGAGIVQRRAQDTGVWEPMLLIYGLIGTAIGAFQWSANPWFVSAKQAIATFMIDHGWSWPLDTSAPWWLLTHYAEQNDVFNLLDGVMIVAYIALTALLLGTWVLLSLLAAGRLVGWTRVRTALNLSYALTPVAGVGAFLGLSVLTVNLLNGAGVDTHWAAATRAVFLAGAVLWSERLLWRLIAKAGEHRRSRRIAAWSVASVGLWTVAATWILMFYVW